MLPELVFRRARNFYGHRLPASHPPARQCRRRTFATASAPSPFMICNDQRLCAFAVETAPTIALPIPLAPPVTMTILSVTFMAVLHPSIFLWRDHAQRPALRVQPVTPNRRRATKISLRSLVHGTKCPNRQEIPTGKTLQSHASARRLIFHGAAHACHRMCSAARFTRQKSVFTTRERSRCILFVMTQREYTWSSIFAWGLTLSGADAGYGRRHRHVLAAARYRLAVHHRLRRHDGVRHRPC